MGAFLRALLLLPFLLCLLLPFNEINAICEDPEAFNTEKMSDVTQVGKRDRN